MPTKPTKARRQRPKHETVQYSVYLDPPLAAEFERCLAAQRALNPDLGLTANSLFKIFIRAGIEKIVAAEDTLRASHGEDDYPTAEDTGEV